MGGDQKTPGQPSLKAFQGAHSDSLGWDQCATTCLDQSAKTSQRTHQKTLPNHASTDTECGGKMRSASKLSGGYWSQLPCQSCSLGEGWWQYCCTTAWAVEDSTPGRIGQKPNPGCGAGHVGHGHQTPRPHRKPCPAVRGVEGPTMGETMQTMSVMQITTPGLTGARKDAGFHNKWMGVVRILILVDDVLSMRPQARGQIGGH